MFNSMAPRGRRQSRGSRRERVVAPVAGLALSGLLMVGTAACGHKAANGVPADVQKAVASALAQNSAPPATADSPSAQDSAPDTAPTDSSSATNSGDTDSTPSDDELAKVQLCKKVTPALASAAVGTTVTVEKALGSLFGTACDVVVPGKPYKFHVRIDGTDDITRQMLISVQNESDVKPVAGLGDEAYIASSPIAMGMDAVEGLWVRRGQLHLEVTVRYEDDSKAPSDTHTFDGSLTKLATAVLPLLKGVGE